MVEVPGYRVLRELGRGGMATVYLAVQESLHREVALKVLSADMASDAEFAERFLREARLVASLHHKHIVQVYDVGTHGGRAYLAMEYLPQGAIAPLAGKVDSATALDCVAQIASALDYGHARGIVHRDVKLENILRHEDGSFTLSDFGIARVTGAATVRTMQGLTLGTPHYMSPERWTGSTFDGRADLYSLGVVLYALLTGKLPYDGVEEVLALGNLHREAPIPLLPARYGRLQGLFAKLLAKRPEDRHPTGAAVVEHVEALRREGAAGDASISEEAHRLALKRTSAVLRDWPFSSAVGAFAEEAPWWRRGPVLAAALILAIAVGGTWAALNWPEAQPGALSQAPTASIAVLPFQYMQTDTAAASIADALADELTTQLARIPGLAVAARSSTRAQGTRDARELGRTLGVANVFEASIRQDAQRLVVSARLIDANTGFQRWAESYSRPAGELWQLQQDLATRVAASLLSDSELASAKERTPAGDAYAHYLRGRQALAAASSDASFAEATKHFEAALAVDAGFARAQGGMCEIAARRAELKRGAEALAHAKTVCDSATAMDPASREVGLAQADVLRMQGQHRQARELYERAAEDPLIAFEATIGLARTHAALNDDDKARALFAKARQLRPGDWRVHAAFGTFLLQRSDFRGAIEAYETALSLSPSDAPRVLNNLASAQLFSDDFAKAAATYERSLQAERTPNAVSNLATARFLAGQYAGAADLYAELLQADPENHVLLGNFADALAASKGPEPETQAAYRRAAAAASAFLAASPDSAETAVSLAWYRANLGDAAGARELLASVAHDSQTNPIVLQRVAETCVRLGDDERARHYLTKAFELGLSRRMAATVPWLAGVLPSDGPTEGEAR